MGHLASSIANGFATGHIRALFRDSEGDEGFGGSLFSNVPGMPTEVQVRG